LNRRDRVPLRTGAYACACRRRRSQGHGGGGLDDFAGRGGHADQISIKVWATFQLRNNPAADPCAVRMACAGLQRRAAPAQQVRATVADLDDGGGVLGKGQ